MTYPTKNTDTPSFGGKNTTASQLPSKNTDIPNFPGKNSSTNTLARQESFDFLLLETGGNLLQETGDRIYLDPIYSLTWGYQTKN